VASSRAPGTLLEPHLEGTLRFRSEAVDPKTGKARPCVVLVDSGSSINITRPWCLYETKVHERPLIVKALGQDLTVDACGEVILLLSSEDGDPMARDPVAFECYELDPIGPPELGVDVLLSAAVGFQLGYLAEMPSATRTPQWKLPRLLWKRERSTRWAGGRRVGQARKRPEGVRSTYRPPPPPGRLSGARPFAGTGGGPGLRVDGGCGSA
jgi:hypothetical protein